MQPRSRKCLLNMKKSNRIVFFNIISTVILQGLAFFSTPIFSRILGAGNYGIVSIYITWVSVVSIIFGLRTNATLSVAINEYPQSEQEKYQSSVLFLSVIIFLFFSVSVLIFITPISSVIKLEKSVILFVLIQGFGNYCVTFANSKFTFEFKAGWNLVLSILTSGGSIALSLAMIPLFVKEDNYWGRILGQAVIYLIVGMAVCIYVFYKGRVFYNKVYWRFCVPIAIPVIFHSLSGLVLNQSDRIMLQHIENNAVVGIYSLAFSFSAVLGTIWTALNNSWVPFYYEFTRKNNIADMKVHAKNYIELYTVLSVGFVLLAPEVFHIFAGRDYWAGEPLIPVFSIGNYFVFLYSFPVNYEFYNKKTSTIAIGTISAGLCNIVLNIIFIMHYGMFGAAAATTVAHILQFLFHHLCARYFTDGNGRYPFKLLPFLSIGAVYILVCMVVGSLSSQFAVRWMAGIGLGLLEALRICKRKSIF